MQYMAYFSNNIIFSSKTTLIFEMGNFEEARKSTRPSVSTKEKISRDSPVLKAVCLQAISPLFLAIPMIVFSLGLVIFGYGFKKERNDPFLIIYSAMVNLMRFSATLNAIIAFRLLIPFKNEFKRRFLRQSPNHQDVLFTSTLNNALSRRRGSRAALKLM